MTQLPDESEWLSRNATIPLLRGTQDKSLCGRDHPEPDHGKEADEPAGDE